MLLRKASAAFLKFPCSSNSSMSSISIYLTVTPVIPLEMSVNPASQTVINGADAIYTVTVNQPGATISLEHNTHDVEYTMTSVNDVTVQITLVNAKESYENEGFTIVVVKANQAQATDITLTVSPVELTISEDIRVVEGNLISNYKFRHCTLLLLCWYN